MPWRLSESLTSDFVFLLFLTSFFHSSLSAETTSLNQVITDGETLVSSARAFELGFFSPDPSSNRRYLGIWFKSIPIQTVVWVANKESPLTDTTGVLSLTAGGNLILSNHIGTFWSTNTSSQKNPIVQLLDSGNLVLTEGTLIIWQSFDYPSNVFLPGMKLGWDSMTNLSRQLTSWKSPHDPSPGLYSHKLRMSGLPEILIWKKSVLWFRTGPWDGRGFGGIPLMRYDNHFAFQFVGNSHEVYFQYGIINIPLTSLAILHSTGVLEHLVWVGDQWSPYWSFPSDQCDNYAACRSYGVCHLDSKFSCECLKGFEPRLTKEWALRDWSGGCLRRVELDCGKVLESSDGFVKVSRLKLPDASNASVNGSMDFDACRNWCLKDCSCKAFAMTGGSKCVIWFGDLVDIRQFANGGEDLYVRLAASELGMHSFLVPSNNIISLLA